ncbi:protein ELYS-like isoform X2 [Aptenodytes patagonicus]|uniref:protein ELYS-like isoform X2 n=1 Tax=Aptenodytes patagonicus TaxID=9234 RepID=UPI003FA12761
MRDLTAQVTSSLLRFPEGTIQALGEDEISLDSVLRGKFSGGRNGLAWLARGPQLEVVNSVTGERRSAYRFSGVNEQPPTVRVVKEFSWQKRTGLLVGLEEAEGSVLCLYDLGISRVAKAVVLPGRVTAIEPITNHGGPSVSTQHLHQSLRWLFGVAAVATDVGHLLLVDLCLDDLACSQNETEASGLEVVTRIPAEVPQRRETVTREGRHLCFQLQNPSGTAISTLCYISRSNQLVVGFSDGYLSLWDMKTLEREHHSQLEGGRVPVYAVTFQEPENDPRNCCYLWAVQSTQESEGDVVSLHLLQLAFGDRKRLASGQVMYEGLEYCDERYSLDLTGGVFPLRGQTSNAKLLSCQTVEKFRNHVDREDSVNEVVSPETSVSIFSWQVNTHGQGRPSTYLGVFDINRWYHAQMPDSLRPEEFLHDCPYFALWSLDTVVSVTSPNLILDILVRERSLSRGVPPSYPPPEQFFHPSTYNFDGTCLLNSGVVRMTCTGFQKETLNFLKKSGPSISEAIHDSYNRCLVAGLLSARLVDAQPSSLSQEEQLEAVLSAAVQAGSLELLTGCIKHWTSEEQPSSAANLRFVLEWTWNKVIYTKDELDQTCVPLFDGSCNFIDPQTLQSLQHCQLLLSNLSTVLNCFLTEAQELTEKGFADLTNKQVVTSLISLYAQVVTWFCRSSLLPEGLDDETRLSRPFYNYPLIQSYYTGHRQKLERLSRGKWDSDCLMIDGMVSQLGDQVEKLWRRDEGGTGKYPPATLHALLDLYLLENIEESYKHAITIYLLLDIMHSFPKKTETSVGSFPTAFAIPWGLVRLIQGFWLLDHNDYESSLALLFHPATVKTVSWQHRRILQSLMCQGEHRRALRYIQVMKPSTSSGSEVRLFLTVLLSNRCVVEAWGLLQRHTTRSNIEELLKHMYEICQEMGLMEDLLKLPFTDTEQECLEKFLQTNAGVQNHEFLLVHRLQRASYIPALQLNRSMKVNLTNDRDPRLRERAVARNSGLDQYGKILPRVQRTLAVERAKPYHLPSSVLREVARPKPLSTVPQGANTGNVRAKVTFIKNVLSTIGEVRVGHEQKTSLSQYDRSLDLVVHPVPSCSAAQSPCRASTSFTASSPLKSNTHGSVSQTTFARASELNLQETPLVVKRAKVLATSASGFPGFTPRSILRSSLRTTPLATPSASPGRSVTPPLRAKERGVSFREENSNAEWTAGNDRDPRLRERAVARNSGLDQYGKILPRVQRTLAVERAKPYHLPSSVLREVARPKPLSTVPQGANTGNVRAKVTFIKNVLSTIGEVRVGHEQKTSLSQYDRSLDLVVHPVPSCSAAQSPCRASTSFTASSPLKSNTHGSVSQTTFARASELNLQETPLVVKRAKVLATSASGFPGFTPRSILRSSLRTTPLATPSASPGRSVTPPLRAKERGVSFREENSNAEWTAGNDRDPRLRERAVARNSGLDQYGKILPRVQRTLAVERAKPYHLPSSVLREVARPKPLSTVPQGANTGNVRAKVTFIKNVLSTIGEVRVGHEQKTSLSQYDRSLDLVVHPVPSCSAAQSPCRASTSFTASSPLKSNTHGSVSQTTFARASELNLQETPLVVKRAKVLATSASGFPGFTPRSILRSSLRTTPLATPSASPGRSVTPPLRAKERGVSFREENSNAEWTAGIACSMLEIYNKQVTDSLSKTRKPGGLKIREDQQQGFYVDGLKLVPCR